MSFIIKLQSEHMKTSLGSKTKVVALAFVGACLLVCCGRAKSEEAVKKRVGDVALPIKDVLDQKMLLEAFKVNNFSAGYLFPEVLHGGENDPFDKENSDTVRLSPAAKSQIAFIEHGAEMEKFSILFIESYEISSGPSLRGAKFRLLLTSDSVRDLTLECVKSENRWFICPPDRRRNENDQIRGKTWFKMGEAFSSFLDRFVVELAEDAEK